MHSQSKFFSNQSFERAAAIPAQHDTARHERLDQLFRSHLIYCVVSLLINPTSNRSLLANGPPLLTHITTVGVLSFRAAVVSQPHANDPSTSFLCTPVTMAANYVTVTPALTELIRYLLDSSRRRGLAPLTNLGSARYLRMKSRSNFVAPSAASWRSTPSKHLAASR